MPAAISAAQFIKKLKTYSSPGEVEKIQRYFKTGKGEYGAGDKFIGVRMGQLFALAKEFIEMPLDEIEKLLESPIRGPSGPQYHGQTSPQQENERCRRKELFDLYLRRLTELTGIWLTSALFMSWSF